MAKDDVGHSLTGAGLASLPSWLETLGFGNSDAAFREKLLSMATPEQRGAIDKTQADLWRGQMDRQMPLQSRDWRLRQVEMPTTEEPPRYGGMTTPAPIRTPSDPLETAARPTPFGNEEYKLKAIETPNARYGYGPQELPASIEDLLRQYSPPAKGGR